MHNGLKVMLGGLKILLNNWNSGSCDLFLVVKMRYFE